MQLHQRPSIANKEYFHMQSLLGISSTEMFGIKKKLSLDVERTENEKSENDDEEESCIHGFIVWFVCFERNIVTHTDSKHFIECQV